MRKQNFNVYLFVRVANMVSAKIVNLLISLCFDPNWLIYTHNTNNASHVHCYYNGTVFRSKRLHFTSIKLYVLSTLDTSGFIHEQNR